MQSEHAPVLRFNVAAFVLCALSMITFGIALHQRVNVGADPQAAAAALHQRERAENELRARELTTLQEKLDALADENMGCTFGPHSSTRAEIERMREKLEALHDERAVQAERLEIMRCRQQAGCTIYSPVY